MLLATVIWHLMIKVSDHHPYISDDNQIISWSLYDDLVFIVSDDYLIISWSWYLVFKVSELKKQNRSLERGSKPGSSSSVAGRGYSHKKIILATHRRHRCHRRHHSRHHIHLRIPSLTLSLSVVRLRKSRSQSGSPPYGRQPVGHHDNNLDDYHSENHQFHDESFQEFSEHFRVSFKS